MKRKSRKERIPVLKRIEIIIPHDKFADAHNVLKEANVGGISHYKIEGSGRGFVETIDYYSKLR